MIRRRQETQKKSANGKNTDDDFSRALAKQGPEGRWLRYLYLVNEMNHYKKRVTDEPLHY